MTKEEWGYDENNGPSKWPELFPEASGSRQSPVDIVTSEVTSDESLDRAPLSFSYLPNKCRIITNTGYGWHVSVDGDGSELCGGPLEDIYKLEQFHCHWGADSTCGSEHTIDGKPYAGELHLVYWNRIKYLSFAEAAAHPDGLAVLGVLLQVGQNDHCEIRKIVSLIHQIPYKGDTAPITNQIDIDQLLPDEKTHYWTYLGSLTTPPCSESVTWILFKEPISVSNQQLDVFRTLHKHERVLTGQGNNCKILKNHRPPAPLFDRIIKTSFNLATGEEATIQIDDSCNRKK